MFGIGSTELIVILVVALLVLGPKKLPEIARTLGKGMAEFKRMTGDVKRTIDMEVDRLESDDKKDKAKKKLYPEKDRDAESESAEKVQTEESDQPEAEASTDDTAEKETASGESGEKKNG